MKFWKILVCSCLLFSCAEYKTVSTEGNEIELVIGRGKKIIKTDFPYQYEIEYRADRIYFYSEYLHCQDSITFKIR